jgi:hypothetical protein
MAWKLCNKDVRVSASFKLIIESHFDLSDTKNIQN